VNRAVPAVAALALLTGCAPAPRAVVSPVADQARVGLTEWQIAVAPPAALPGQITLNVTNAGSTAHDLRVDGAIEPASVPVLEPGQTATLTVQAKPGGDLRLWCGVPGHRQAGMDAMVQVTEGAGT